MSDIDFYSSSFFMMVVKRIARTLFSCAGSVYWRARAAPPLWRFLNREARRMFLEHPRPLAPAEARALAGLERYGIAALHISDIMPAEVFTVLSEYVSRRRASPEVEEMTSRHRQALLGEAKIIRKKAFLVDLWPGGAGSTTDQPILDLQNPFIRFSLAEPILKIANAYLGAWSKFRGWRLEATIPMPEGAGPRASQRWHRDEEDLKLVKTFLYLNDVDEASGPFMYVRSSHRGGKWQDLFPMVPPRGSLPMPPNVDDFIPKEDVLVLTGSAGTLIFCDTTGLHQGGFAKAEPRFMYTSIYTTAVSPWPIRYTYPEHFDASALSPVQRYAVENDPNQREPRFYR